MKKTIFFAMLLLAMVSCSQSEDFQTNTIKNIVVEPYSGTAHDIWTNILGNRFGGYTKGRLNTRAEGSFSITPYIEEGDTLMYIAQYEKGWELYSASKATNMLICSSEKGVFDLNDPNMPEALRALIEDECAAIKQSLNDKIEKVDDSWSSSAILKNGFSNDIITYTKNGQTKTLSESDLTPGHWVC